MKIVGFKRANFTAKDGTEVHGYQVYVAHPINANGAGIAVERVYLSDAKIAQQPYAIDDLLGREVAVYYNRYGKVATISTVD